jgi:hypothetical protein
MGLSKTVLVLVENQQVRGRRTMNSQGLEISYDSELIAAKGGLANSRAVGRSCAHAEHGEGEKM